MRLSHTRLSDLVDRFVSLSDDANWNRFTSIRWEALQPDLLTKQQRSAVAFITFIEDHLPGYFAEYSRRFPIDEDTPIEESMRNRQLYHFFVRWAQEEDRHAHVLVHYQRRAGLASAEELDRALAIEGRKRFTIEFTEPLQVFIYGLLQEKATQLYYQQLRDAIREPVLKSILIRLARDEARHFAFFFNVIGAYLEEFGDAVIPHMKAVLQDFKMPLYNTLTNYWRWALVICEAAGGYSHTDAYEELVKLVNRFADASTRSNAADMIEIVHRVRQL